jgi:SpoVK/Ycf46/Vps4 family AAA+-type ATPase
MKAPFKLGLFIVVFVLCVLYFCPELTKDPEVRVGNKTVTLSSYERNILDNCLVKKKSDDYTGSPELIQEFRYIVNSLKTKSTDAPAGVLLYGPPGTGKTTLANQVARDTEATFLLVSPDCVENKYQGESFKLMRAVFTLAKKLGPCVVFFDEIDGVMARRSDLDQSHTNTMKTMFLTGMDSLKPTEDQVLVVGATNRPGAIDSALMRRLEIHLQTDYPTPEELETFLKQQMPEALDNEFVKQLEPNTSLHDLNTFIKFCKRRNESSDLSTLYSEYTTIYKYR